MKDTKNIIMAVALIGGVFCVSQPAGAILILTDTFEDIGADGTPVTTRTLDGVTIEMSVATGAQILAYTYFDNTPLTFGGALQSSGPGNDPLNPENVSGERFIASNPFGVNNPIIFTFSTLLESFGLTTIDLLEERGNLTDFVTLIAFDELGQVVDEQTRSGRLGPSGFDLDWLVSANGNQISEVHLFGTVTAFSGYGIDDLVLIRVPEPSTLALFVIGLAGLGFMMRRRRRSMQLRAT